jgi:hypothetical protein
MARVLSALLDARDRLIERRRSDAASKDLLFTIDVLHRQAVEIQTRVAQPVGLEYTIVEVTCSLIL